MIVTHTQNAEGYRRLYLGGKSSLECWIEPDVDGVHWSFHAVDAFTGNPLSEQDRAACLAHQLLGLARMLDVAPAELVHLPYEVLASCHTGNPLDSRRMAAPRNRVLDHAFMTTPPDIRRPAADFRAHAAPTGARHRR